MEYALIDVPLGSEDLNSAIEGVMNGIERIKDRKQSLVDPLLERRGELVFVEFEIDIIKTVVVLINIVERGRCPVFFSLRRHWEITV